MASERWQRLQELFHSALDLGEHERDIFLSRTCAEDDELRDQIEWMVSRQREAQNFLESPPFGATELLSRCEAELGPIAPAKIAYAPMIGKTVSHYRIVEMVGAGGMGTVYKAEDTTLGRFVALKFLSSAGPVSSIDDSRLRQDTSIRSQALECLQREARVCSALDHPNICTVYEVSQHEGSSFIAMQFLTGRTLKDEIGGKALPVERILELSIQIAEALDAAHAAGIIHRDIKPTNVFVNQRGEVKLLDFGLAKTQATPDLSDEASTISRLVDSAAFPSKDTLSRPGMAFGTVAYMSPEQVLGHELDARTDLFSLGIVLYEMATGTPPFGGEVSASIFDAILHNTPSPASELNPALPKELERIINKAMNKDREKRPQRAADLRDALVRLKRASNPESITQRQRNWLPVAGLAALISLLLVIAIFAFYTHFGTQRSVQPQNPISLILADFENFTGEPIFDETLKQGLRSQLEQSPFLNLVSDQKMTQELRHMGQSPDTRLSWAVAREICLRTGSKIVLAGSVAPLGKHFVLGLQAVNCQSGDMIGSERVEAEDREKILPALGKAATGLRVTLGESSASVGQYDSPIEQATTTSLEALQAYTLATKTRFSEGPTASIPFFERATKLDPEFAMAYARLGTVYSALNQSDRAIPATTRAYELRARVSERERFYIESHYYLDVTGEYDKAIQTFKMWQQDYPYDTIPYVNLGAIYTFLGQHEDNVDEQRQALLVDPSVEYGYANLAIAYINLNQFGKARDILNNPGVSNSRFEDLRYELAFFQGDTAEMKRQVDLALSHRELGDRLLAAQADTEAFYGNVNRAREFTREAVDSAVRGGDAESAIGYRIVSALREAEFGNLREAKRQVAALPPLPTQWTRVLGALALARTGDAPRAIAVVDDLHRQFPSNTLMNGYWLPTIRAAAELSSGRPSKAIEMLESTIPYELGAPQTPTNVVVYPIYLRGIAFLQAGNGARAAEEFQEILDHPGIVANYPLGSLARLGLARAYAIEAGVPITVVSRRQREKQGTTNEQMGVDALAKSRKAYRDFFALWKQADPDILVLKQAKKEYAKLQ